jgi:hypothetical protein
VPVVGSWERLEWRVGQAVGLAGAEVGESGSIGQKRTGPRVRDGELDLVVLDECPPTVAGALVQHDPVRQPVPVVRHDEHLEPDVRLVVAGQLIYRTERDRSRLCSPNEAARI